MTITAGELRCLFSYEPSTGRFTRMYDPVHGRKDKPTGSVARNGYLQLKVGGRVYAQHRLAWLYVHGRWPEGVIDHINGDRTDNRIANLRDVPQSINAQNRRTAKRTSAVGVLGVGVTRTPGRFTARIRHAGRNLTLGTFDSVEEASRAYQAAKARLHAGAVLA
jgi:hypothetical protein